MNGAMQTNINLLETKTDGQLRIICGGLGIVLLLVMGGLSLYWYLSLSREIVYQQTMNTNLKAEVKKIGAEIEAVKPIQEMEKETTARSQKVKALQELQVSHLELRNEIDKLIPSGMLLVTVNINLPKVVVNGFCAEHSLEARFLDNLKTSSRFKNVTVLTSDMDENTKEAKFTMEMDWEGAEK